MRKNLPPQLGEVTLFATPEQYIRRARSMAKKAFDHALTIPDGKNPLILVDESAGVGRKTKAVDVAEHQPWNRGEDIAPLPIRNGVIPLNEASRNLPSQFAETLKPKIRELLYHAEANGAAMLNGEEIVELARAKRSERAARFAEILQRSKLVVSEVRGMNSGLDQKSKAV
ncbi:MAG TPA: hypothetical protein VGE34_02820 [Candidatus Saccharimonadales bacterium]